MGDIGTASVGDLNDSVPQEQVDIGPVGKDVYMLTRTGVESNRSVPNESTLMTSLLKLLYIKSTTSAIEEDVRPPPTS